MRRNLASSLQDQMRQTAERQAYDPCTLDTFGLVPLPQASGLSA